MAYELLGEKADARKNPYTYKKYAIRNLQWRSTERNYLISDYLETYSPLQEMPKPQRRGKEDSTILKDSRETP